VGFNGKYCDTRAETGIVEAMNRQRQWIHAYVAMNNIALIQTAVSYVQFVPKLYNEDQQEKGGVNVRSWTLAVEKRMTD
jgi:hypothetical protein